MTDNADPTPHQLTDAHLSDMTPAEIVAAKHAGRLDLLLGVPADDVAVLDRARHGSDPLETTDVQRLLQLGAHHLIVAARESGRIN